MCMSALQYQLFNRVYNLITHLYCVACKTGYKKSSIQTYPQLNALKTPVVPMGVLKEKKQVKVHNKLRLGSVVYS